MFRYVHNPRDPDAQPHAFKPKTRVWATDFEPVQRWCAEQFGDRGLRWVDSAGHFWFRDAEDAFAFKMRWC